MSYKSETIAAVLQRLNVAYFLPAMQREFVWSAEQVCSIFDSLMRQYPISSFLFWQIPLASHDDVEAYEFLHTVRPWGNRARLASLNGSRDVTFVLDGQQRLTSMLVGLRGTYVDRRSRSGKGSRTPVPKKLHLDLLHDGRLPDEEGETYYNFDFFDFSPTLLNRSSYWFEVGRILNVEGKEKLGELVERQARAIKDVRPLTSHEAKVMEHNLTRLHEAVWSDQAISYHTERDPDHERILEIFVRANSGGTVLSKSDLLLSTLTLHWGSENAREEINGFVDELNAQLTRKNKLTKDFVMKNCLVLLNLPVAYRVSSFTKDTCTRIRDRWDDIRGATRRAVDAANLFGIDEANLTSANALIPIAYYLFQHPRIDLRSESSIEVRNASRVRVWLLSALLNRVFGGSSDAMLSKLRDVLQIFHRTNGDFPIGRLDDAVRTTGRIAASSQEAVENVLRTSYGDSTCFLALSLLYDDRNWGTISYSIDHLFAQDTFKRNLPDHIRELRHDFGNLSLITLGENSGKQDSPLDEWLPTRSPEYLKRHLIPADPALWRMDRFEQFLIERRKMIRARLEQVFAYDSEDA